MTTIDGMLEPIETRSARVARRVSPWQLGLAILVFVLPFASVSCATPRGYGSGGGGITARYSGVSLAFGGNPTVEAAGGAPAPGPLSAEDAIPGQIAVTVALALTVAAFAISVARPGRLEALVALPALAVIGLIVGVAGFDSWLTIRIVQRLESLNVAPQQGFPPEEYVRPDLGFAAAVLLLVVTLLLNGFALLRRRRSSA